MFSHVNFIPSCVQGIGLLLVGLEVAGGGFMMFRRN